MRRLRTPAGGASPAGRRSKSARRWRMGTRFAARLAARCWDAPNTSGAIRRRFSGCERARSAPEANRNADLSPFRQHRHGTDLQSDVRACLAASASRRHGAAISSNARSSSALARYVGAAKFRHTSQRRRRRASAPPRIASPCAPVERAKTTPNRARRREIGRETRGSWVCFARQSASHVLPSAFLGTFWGNGGSPSA